jgi:hypothetical protein
MLAASAKCGSCFLVPPINYRLSRFTANHLVWGKSPLYFVAPSDRAACTAFGLSSACPPLPRFLPPSLAHRLRGSRCRDRARHRRISDSSSACVKSTSACRPMDERSGGKWCLHRLLLVTCDTLRQRLLQHHDSQHAVPIPHTRGGIQ